MAPRAEVPSDLAVPPISIFSDGFVDAHKSSLSSSQLSMFQKKRSEGDSQGRAFVLTARTTYVRIPGDRVLICGDEPTDVCTLARIVKRFIAEASTEMFTLEIEAHVE